MKAQIWKYTIPKGVNSFTLDIPSGGMFISVQVQNGEICLWFTVATHLQKKTRTFKCVLTGLDFDLSISDRYLGTCQLGQYVVHIFETTA